MNARLEQSRQTARRVAVFTALISVLAVQPRSHGAAAADEAQVEKRLAAVAILIEKSSAAQQIESSADARAIAGREQARKLYAAAQAAHRAGDYAQASELLQQASTRMFEAVRLAAPEQVTAPREQADLQTRFDSVRALAAAQKRIAADKPNTPGGAETAREIDKLVSQAQARAAAKDIPSARALLERAYLIAKAAVSSMRSGDTLVRTLNFTSREEEYSYEVDRNDTHEMLIKVLLKDKPRSDSEESSIQHAYALRAQADAAARGGDHANAVKLLEESTRELVRAIRSAGVFIPG